MLKKEKIIKASNKLKSKKMAKLATQNRIIKIIIAIIFILQILQPINVQANTVEYNGQKGLIATPNDFFLNINELLPGDTKEDVAYIKNTTNNEIEVFFKTEPIDKTEYYDDIDYSLLEKIKLKITLKSSNNSEEKTIYDGNLGAELMNNYISLGKYTKKYNGELKFKIEVPTDLKNDYTLSTTKVKWVFAVEKTKDNTNKNEDTKDENKLNNNTNENEDTKDKNKLNNNTNKNYEDTKDKNLIEKIIDTVKTGDNIFYTIAILIICAIIVIVLVAQKVRMNKRKNKKGNKDKIEK